jgi:hypothetical protein
MGLPRFLLCSALLAAVCFPPALRGQFKEPTKDELQMTSDAKAPGASAVYLYREDITDQGSSTRTYYDRIKVLTEKGKELATTRLPYEPETEKIASVEGRTIHADGTIVPLTEKPSELVDLKTKGYQLNTLVVTLPSVEVGSIIEYRIKVKYSIYAPNPTWIIQGSYFAHKAHYFFKTANAFNTPGWVARMAVDTKIVSDNNGLYTLDIDDVPALPDEDWMPPLNTVKWRVYFFYTSFRTKEEYWKQVGKNWGSMMHDWANPTGGMKKAVAEIVAPGDTDTQKAQKIYAAVMNLENTDFTREKTKAERKKEKIRDINTIEDVWKGKRGSSDDIALLYVAMCRAAGLKVDPMVVTDRSRALFDEGILNARQVDDFIAVAQLDGKEVYLDPGEKMCPFGMLHWKHTVAAGYRLVDKTAIIAHTPAGEYTASSLQRLGDLTIDENGGVTGTVRFILKGQPALYWRHVALQNDQEEVKKRFNESMKNEVPDGVQVDFDHFLALEDYSTNLMAIVKVSGNLGAATGKRFFLPAFFFQAHAKHPFVAQDKRITAVDVHYPETELDDVTYHLPAGYTVESAPERSNLSWPDRALFKVGSLQKEGSVQVARSLTYNYTILDAKAYSGLHDFYQKVASADQQQIVLKRAGTASGN